LKEPGHRRWSNGALAALAVFSVFTLVAIVDSSQYYFGQRLSERPVPFWRAAAYALPEWWLWALLTPVIVWAGRRLPIQRPHAVRNAVLHLFWSVAIALAHLFVSLSLAWVTDPAGRSAPTFGAFFQMRLYFWFHVELLIYWAILGFSLAVDYYRQSRRREVREAQLEARLAHAKLEALKMQLHPHFLFNTLNAVSVLVRKGENQAAVRMIAGLSDLLRLALDKSGAQEVTLEEEMHFLDRYLSIEKIRFGDRLRVSVDVPRDALDARVPNLVLQPLVENAIRHGIAPQPGAGRLDIRADVVGDRLRLRVVDDGVGVNGSPPASAGAGVGLRNTRERLRQLYGDRFRLELLPGRGRGTEAVLEIPLRFEDNVDQEVAHEYREVPSPDRR
jgi:anti-sigma regulatory factor (Ser/Thr protein kinase)